MKPKRNIPHAKKILFTLFFQKLSISLQCKVKKNTFKKILILKKIPQKKVSIYLLCKERKIKNNKNKSNDRTC